MSNHELIFLPVHNDLVIAYSSASVRPSHEHLRDICHKAHPEAFGSFGSLFRDWKKITDDATKQPLPLHFVTSMERLYTEQTNPNDIFALRYWRERNCVVTQRFQLNR